MKKYIIGVDGGNTKTDYLLFDTLGNFVDGIRSGTCSHESPKVGGFANATQVMKENILSLLEANNLTIDDVEVGVFGLAGVDAPFQKKALEEGVESIGFKNHRVVNDGFLGIKAASTTGSGVCSINGTGTVNVGIDDFENWLQVGGIGDITGDEAGGSFLARQAVKIAYDEAYRFGETSSVTKYVYQMYEIDNKAELSNSIIGKRIDSTFLVKTLFACANEGDKAAIKVLRTAGNQMGRGIAGIIKELNFVKPVNVILAGSVWAKATNFEMLDSFKETIKSHVDNECNYIILNEPPVMGAILWGLEIVNNEYPNVSLKNKVLADIIKYQKRFD